MEQIGPVESLRSINTKLKRGEITDPKDSVKNKVLEELNLSLSILRGISDRSDPICSRLICGLTNIIESIPNKMGDNYAIR